MRCSSSSGSRRVDRERVETLSRDAGRDDPSAGGARHVAVFALRIDDVGDDASADPAQDSELGRERLSGARPREDGGVCVEMRTVPRIVDDGGAGAQIDALQRPAARVEIGRREWGRASRRWRCPSFAKRLRH